MGIILGSSTELNEVPLDPWIANWCCSLFLVSILHAITVELCFEYCKNLKAMKPAAVRLKTDTDENMNSRHQHCNNEVLAYLYQLRVSIAEACAGRLYRSV